MHRSFFGERSFAFENSSYQNRKIGQTARVKAAQENLENQPNFELKNKKFLKCQKKLLNGLLKKSKVVKCLSLFIIFILMFADPWYFWLEGPSRVELETWGLWR